MMEPYLRHLKSGKDLETTYEAIRAGFVALALEKNRRATLFVEQARTALSRIHEAFARNQLKPHTFFIGAAIEPKMSLEIWSCLDSGILENAANLTDEDQIASLTRWLCSL